MKERYGRKQFESIIRELVKPLNNQYPRPWMTKLDDPRRANVFVVGMNQRNGYRTDAVSHKRHVAALFNRPPGECRRLYEELTDSPSRRTRKNIDALVGKLEDVGVENVLETNVICYSTPMSKHLRDKSHAGGAKHGEEIFRFLLSSIDVRVLIVHGVGAMKKLKSILQCDLPDPPKCPADGLSSRRRAEMLILTIPSLGQPGYNMWSSWAPKHLTRVAKAAARHLRRRRSGSAR